MTSSVRLWARTAATVAALALTLSACGGGGGGLVTDGGKAMLKDVDLSNVTSGFMAQPGSFQVAAGQSVVRGDVEFACASGGTDCTVTVLVDANGTITARSTGGAVTAMNSEDYQNMSLLEKWQRFEDGNPTLRMTSDEVLQAWRTIWRRNPHTIILSGSAPVTGDGVVGEEVIHPEAVPCLADECHLEEFAAGIQRLASVLEHNGVRIAEFESRTTHVDSDGEKDHNEFEGYGGWLNHTFFVVTVNRECHAGPAGCSGPHFSTESFALTFGAYSGTSPSGTGSATWSGVMVGMEAVDSYIDDVVPASAPDPDVFLGDARIVIEDLATPDVDVSFTNISNVTEGTGHPDMSWENLPVDDGLFARGSWGGYIAGMFTGPEHQEVGGEFFRDGIWGGFGAKRQ